MQISEPLIKAVITALMSVAAALNTSGGQVTDKPAVKEKTPIVTEQNTKPLSVKELKANTISVSTIKVTWKAEKDRDYKIDCYTEVGYAENMYFEFRGKDTCYINGLREGSEYEITVTPELKDGEEKELEPKTITAHTEKVDIIYTFPHEDGWTSCFAGEPASGLKYMPASGAIYGSVVDPVTHTGIRRDEYGDYCAALGLFYGVDGDRYLVTMNNGTQFTVKQCDSKGWADDGEGKYHWFGGKGNGKCIVEFIYDDNALPSCVAFNGSWGYWNWYGLDLGSNIQSIQKINYGEPIEY